MGTVFLGFFVVFKIFGEISDLSYLLGRLIIRRLNVLVFWLIYVFLIKLFDILYLCFEIKLY